METSISQKNVDNLVVAPQPFLKLNTLTPSKTLPTAYPVGLPARV